jgi:hypothetical protein
VEKEFLFVKGILGEEKWFFYKINGSSGRQMYGGFE